MTIAPEMLLPPSAMPWGRSVESRILELENLGVNSGLHVEANAAAGNSSLDGLIERVSELSKLTRIDKYDIPPFSVTYAANPIGTNGVVELPTWYLNIPPTAEFVTVLTFINTFDTNPAINPLAGRKMGYRVGSMRSTSMEAVMRPGNPSLASGQVVRSAMLTVPAEQPLAVQLAFQHSAITGGTISGTGSVTAILYGR